MELGLLLGNIKRNMKGNNFLFGDFINRLNLAMYARRISIDIYYNNFVLDGLSILKKVGAIHSFFILHNNKVRVYLKHMNGRMAVRFGLVSKPGKRVYWNLLTLRKKIGIYSDTDLFIISTKFGLMSSDECLVRKLGGEILFRVKVLC